MVAARSARFAGIALGVGSLLAVLFYPTDEKRVREAAEAIVKAANESPAELARALDTYATANVSVSAEELPAMLVGREALVAAATRAGVLGQRLRFRVEGAEVTVQGKQARLNADLITAAQAEVPELRRPRHSVALFEKTAGRFRLVSVEVGAERRDQPEARP
jgi:hypothetical protein